MQAETLFNTKVRRRLEKIPNSFWLKTQEVNKRGIPDFLGCIAGQMIALESKLNEREPFKDAGRVVLQRYILLKIRRSGGYAKFITPDTFDRVYNELMEMGDYEGEA